MAAAISDHNASVSATAGVTDRNATFRVRQRKQRKNESERQRCKGPKRYHCCDVGQRLLWMGAEEIGCGVKICRSRGWVVSTNLYAISSWRKRPCDRREAADDRCRKKKAGIVSHGTNFERARSRQCQRCGIPRTLLDAR